MRKGMGGHQSRAAGSHVWLTPPHVIEALGSFDLDPCSLDPRPWPTAASHYAPPQDGLILPWYGRVWLNPPYGDHAGKWLAKLGEHGRGTALIFARTETESFFRQVWDQADALLFLRGRLHFHFPDGRRARHNAGAPSVLAAYGEHDMERLASSGLDGKFVPLPNGSRVVVSWDVSWMDLLVDVFKDGGEKGLGDVYAMVSEHPKARGKKHWREQIRKKLQQGPFERVGRGVYRAKEVA